MVPRHGSPSLLFWIGTGESWPFLASGPQSGNRENPTSLVPLMTTCTGAQYCLRKRSLLRLDFKWIASACLEIKVGSLRGSNRMQATVPVGEEIGPAKLEGERTTEVVLVIDPEQWTFRQVACPELPLVIDQQHLPEQCGLGTFRQLWQAMAAVGGLLELLEVRLRPPAAPRQPEEYRED